MTTTTTSSFSMTTFTWHRLKAGLDSGLWTLDSGLWTLDSGLWTLDSGLWTLDSGLWTLDSGLLVYIASKQEIKSRRPFQ